MATRRYKSKKQLSKKHGKKSKNHKKRVKKTRKYRKKRGGLLPKTKDEKYVPPHDDISELDKKYVPPHDDISELDKKYVPQYDGIMDTLTMIDEGNQPRVTILPNPILGRPDIESVMKPTDELNRWASMKNKVSCGIRLLMRDNLNCHKQKNRLYKNITTKIGLI